MSAGEIFTRWTARLALCSYVIAAGALLQRRPRPARIAWTTGCIVYLGHAGAAFHFYHQWSHEAAYRETARQTAELFGWNWGGGLYWNYLFTALWTADAAWWWVDASGYRARPRWLSFAIHGFMAFMAFQATVVFGSGPVRWAGAIAALGLAALWRRRSHERPRV